MSENLYDFTIQHQIGGKHALSKIRNEKLLIMLIK